MPRMRAHAARLRACGALAVGDAIGSVYARPYASQAGCMRRLHAHSCNTLPAQHQHPHPTPPPPQLDEATSTRRAQLWPRRCAASTARRASSRRVDVELLGLEVRRLVDSASDPRGSDPASDCAKTGHSRSVTCLGGQHVQRRGRWCVETGLFLCRTRGWSRPKPKPLPHPLPAAAPCLRVLVDLDRVGRSTNVGDVSSRRRSSFGAALSASVTAKVAGVAPTTTTTPLRAILNV